MSLSHHKERDKGYPYHLIRPNSDKQTGIYLKTSFNNLPFKYGIAKSIYPELWDSSVHRPTTNSRLINKYINHNPNIKTELSNVKTRIENINRTIKNYLSDLERKQEILNLRELKDHLDETIKKVIKPSQGASTPFLLDYLTDMIQGMEKGTVTIMSGKKKGLRYSQGAITNYVSLKNKWIGFEKYIGKKIRFESITSDTYNKLIEYFNTKGYSTNYKGKQIQFIISTMNRAFDEGVHNNQIQTTKSFAAIEDEVYNVYLTPSEVERLERLSYKDRPKYQLSLDGFLIGVYSTLRFSDWSRIRPTHIKQRGDKKEIHMITKKTGDKVIIPISTKLDAILSKYNYSIPRIYSQKVNDHIKDIAKDANINDPIEVVKTKGALKTKTVVAKYKLLSSHSARRTGVSIMVFHEKIDPQLVLKLTGHKTTEMLMKYVKVTKEEAAAEIAELDYFNRDKTESKVVNLSK